jgi:hypothetical protein
MKKEEEKKLEELFAKYPTLFTVMSIAKEMRIENVNNLKEFINTLPIEIRIKYMIETITGSKEIADFIDSLIDEESLSPEENKKVDDLLNFLNK